MKKLLVVLLSVIIIASCLTFSASAAGSLKVTASTSSIDAGSAAPLTLTLSELPAGSVNLIHFKVTYDSSVFTLNGLSNKEVAPASSTLPSGVEVTIIAEGSVLDVYLINWNKIEGKSTSSFAASQNLVISFTAKTGTSGKDYSFTVSGVEYGFDAKILESDRISGTGVNASGKIKYARGDLDKNGKVSSDDAIYLLRYTMRPTKYPIEQSGDMNGDSKVNSDDAIYLLRYTMRPDKYPLAPEK